VRLLMIRLTCYKSYSRGRNKAGEGGLGLISIRNKLR